VVLFGFEQRNDLRPAKYLWPFNVLVVIAMMLKVKNYYSPLKDVEDETGTHYLVRRYNARCSDNSAELRAILSIARS
jgi:hypothetical protein